MFATEAPLYFVEAPRSQEPSRHVLPGPCADRQLPSSATVPDTSFPPTCFAEVFRSSTLSLVGAPFYSWPAQ